MPQGGENKQKFGRKYEPCVTYVTIKGQKRIPIYHSNVCMNLKIKKNRSSPNKGNHDSNVRPTRLFDPFWPIMRGTQKRTIKREIDKRVGFDQNSAESHWDFIFFLSLPCNSSCKKSTQSCRLTLFRDASNFSELASTPNLEGEKKSPRQIRLGNIQAGIR